MPAGTAYAFDIDAGKRSILELFNDDMKRIDNLPQSKTLTRIYNLLKKTLVISIKDVAKELEISIPSATSGLKYLEKSGIVKEGTGFTRNRVFQYFTYLNILNDESDPIVSNIDEEFLSNSIF